MLNVNCKKTNPRLYIEIQQIICKLYTGKLTVKIENFRYSMPYKDNK